jgi:tRNA G37 N-methylase Trm5
MHLYTFSDEKEPFNKLRDALKRSVLSAGRSVKDVETRIVKEVAPYKLQVAVDAKVT